MKFYYIMALGAVAFYVVSAQVGANEAPESGLADRANPAAKAVAKILGGLFASAAAGCLAQAAEQCKSHWRHPSQALSCGKNFLRDNKGRCAA